MVKKVIHKDSKVMLVKDESCFPGTYQLYIKSVLRMETNQAMIAKAYMEGWMDGSRTSRLTIKEADKVRVYLV